MNKHQKLVQQQFLDNEETVIKRLKTVYTKSLQDITGKTKVLQDEINSIAALIDLTDDATDKATLKSMEQSKIYQKQYQDALKKQVSSVLDNLQVEEFTTVSDYLRICYEDGFIGTMYDLQGQGIPLCFPIDQQSMVRAVQLDSKISEGLYKHLGENIAQLKKHITAQVSRGISTGMSFSQVAQQLSYKMMGTYENPGGAYAYALRIARTEGHRIQVQAGADACYKAKESGADVVKQWDSTLDSRTRKSHKKVDGEIRELDEKFSNGLMFPGDPNGKAREVIHCRCALLQRARWALDKDELQTLKDRAEYYGLDKTKNFAEYKEKYLKAAETEKVLTNYVNGDIMSGGKHGALNDTNDPDYEKRKAHAELYYEELRNSDKDSLINAISKNASINNESVSKAYKHLFVDDHGFVEDYDMAESLRRLRTNDNIQEHDKILILHEALEFDIMAENPKMPYTQAHKLTEETYNYAEALKKWKKGEK